MIDRGEYRPWYTATIDDPDFQTMPGDVFKLLFVLKASLPAAGIGVIQMLITAERCGCTPPELDARLSILAQPKPDSELGWIVRERNIIWIVNGLRNERGLSPKSAEHRTFIAKTLQPLGDKKIVHDFRRYYRPWFPSIFGGLEGVSGESEGGQQGASDHKIPDTKTENPETRDVSAAAAREMSRLLITRLNQGMQDNPLIGDAMQPIPHGHGLSLNAAEEILTAGVSSEFASARVYDIAKGYAPSGRNRQIKSLGYCVASVVDAWEAQGALRAASSTSRPAGKSHSNGKRPKENAGEANYRNARAALGD